VRRRPLSGDVDAVFIAAVLHDRYGQFTATKRRRGGCFVRLR
jgi:hypothetical protein